MRWIMKKGDSYNGNHWLFVFQVAPLLDFEKQKLTVSKNRRRFAKADEVLRFLFSIAPHTSPPEKTLKLRPPTLTLLLCTPINTQTFLPQS